MNILLWVLQVVLAWLSIAGGMYQIFKFEELQKGVAAMRSLPRGLWAFLGAFGCVGGLGLILPAALNLLPILTPIFAIVMVVHSAVVSALYLIYGDRAPLPFSMAMMLLAAFIAYGRFVLLPF